MIVIDISLEEAKQRLADAWRAGNLGVQGGENVCLYQYPCGRVCAVGAIMTPEQREAIKDRNIHSIGDLVVNGRVVVNDYELEQFLYAAQSRHDAGDLEKFRQFLVDNKVPIHA